MKKMVVAAAVAAMVAGSVFAEGFTLSGGLYSGLNVNVDDWTTTLSVKNVDYGNSRLRINGNYSKDNVGFKSRVEFASDAKIASSVDTTKGTWAANLATPQLKFAYGYANLFNDALNVQVGYLDSNPIGPNFIGKGKGGTGVTLKYNTPVKGLFVGLNAYTPSKSDLSATLTEDFWKDTLYYGAGYSNDYFGLTAGFGRDAKGNAGALLTKLTLSPVEQFSLTAETDFFGLTEGKAKLEAYGDISLSLVKELGLELYYAVNAGLADPSLDLCEFELEASYDVNETVAVKFNTGLDFNQDDFGGFYVTPGAKFKLGGGASLDARYGYVSEKGAGAYLGKSGDKGHTAMFDFAWAF